MDPSATDLFPAAPTSARLWVGVLGPLEVWVDGEEASLRPAQRRLLSILLLEPGREFRTGRLIELMWGDHPPRAARNTLQVHVSGLRKTAPLVASTPRGYRIDLAACDVDLVAFEDQAEAARAQEDEAWGAAREMAMQALALWRGDPFAELEDDAFALATRVRLEEVQTSLVESLAEAHLALGRNDVVLADMRALSEREPLRERPVRLLMHALYRSGRQSEALRLFQAFRRRLGEATGLEPGEALRSLEERILLQSPTLGVAMTPTTPHNLPAVGTSFIGREDELDAVLEMIGQHRVVTIAGGPGAGKSRLGVEAGRAALDLYPGGVWMARLAGATTDRSVAATVAAATATSEQVDSFEELAAALRDRPILVVLDNCEHVTEPIRRFLMAMIGRPGRCKVLATSRRPLNISGEAILRLAPLAIDKDLSVALLVDRARSTNRSFSVTPENTEWLLEICRKVGGLPLAIELVSRWVPSIGLGDTARLLEQALGDTALATAFEWSAQLIPAEDRRLLSAVTVFASSFTLGRAHEVCGGTAGEIATAGSISRLVDASLLGVEWSGGSTRYHMLEPVRELAAAQLEPDEVDRLRRRHVESFASSAAWIEVASIGAEQSQAAATLDVEMPDYRDALGYLRDRGNWSGVAAIAPALVRYWYARFLGWEGRSWLDEIPLDELSQRDQVRVQQSEGFLAWAVHDYEDADRRYTACLEAGRHLGDPRVVADALYGLGQIHHKRRFRDGAAMLAEAAAIYANLDGCELELGQCLMFSGIGLALTGRVDRAEEALLRAAELLRSVGHLRQVSKAERWLANCAWRRADEPAARQHALAAESLARDIGDQIATSGALVELANIEIRWGDIGLAARHLAEAFDPVPLDDEVDVTQVLQPIARLALTVGEAALAAAILAHIDDVYERHGWRPLDDDPEGKALRKGIGGVQPQSGAVRDEVANLLARIGGA